MSTDLPRESIDSSGNPAEGETGRETAGTEPIAESKFRVLIVDDEVDLRAFLAEFCTLNGYVAECAGNGLAALQSIESSPFDLVIVDYLMPDVSGVEFVKRVKEKRPDLLVIAMSAWYDMESAFLKAGADRFMKKPFDPYLLEEELAMLAKIAGKWTG
jgi:DNA-binding response OmpR family regulator